MTTTTTPPAAASSSSRTPRQRPWYGQIVVGPPGCGKTTYCSGMQEYLRLLGRNAWVINLDPANEGYSDPEATTSATGEKATRNDSSGVEGSLSLPYETLVDVKRDMIDLSSVMEQLDLGPNGGLMYCMEYLDAHVQEFIELIEERAFQETAAAEDDTIYLLLDCPGQVELFTHNRAIPNLIETFVKKLNLRLCGVQLIDSQYCTDAMKFLSAALVSTMTMVRLELPMVSVLSKVDLLGSLQGGDGLPMSLEFFTDCPDLTRLIPFLENGGFVTSDHHSDDNTHYADDLDYQKARQDVRRSTFSRKYTKLHTLLAEVVDDYSLLNFVPCDIQSAESVGRVVAKIDQCTGYVFAGGRRQTDPTATTTPQDLFQCAAQAESSVSHYETIADIQERMSMPQIETMNEPRGEESAGQS